MLEEQIINLAGHFRYLALLLDAYDKCYPKIDRFVQQLQFSDTGVSGGISRKRNIIAPSSRGPFGLQALREWGYILAQD